MREDLDDAAPLSTAARWRRQTPRLISVACACLMILGTNLGVAAAWNDRHCQQEAAETAMHLLRSTDDHELRCQALLVARRRIVGLIEDLQTFQRSDLSLAESTEEALRQIHVAATPVRSTPR